MAHSNTHELGHRIGFQVHFTILAILVVFTVITVYAAGIDFGNPNYNIIVAMIIASIKATLVGMYFMHLRYENPLIIMFVVIPFVLLAIMIGGLFLDNPTRTVPGKSSYLISQAEGTTEKAAPASHGASH